ncbi:hypothetical protein [Autumnicola psychrophila]|uniref:DUF3188 domain-containing protein n=1 Tax=Autumnicola psychrophila TaxID=3075592 RepID=A0ABU3DRV8_9FLAO|nr:hypothetical protein [Zunongwangia sp. F225]MDT0685827.1 hypothetical protein [Zunongwangia sp. F225]
MTNRNSQVLNTVLIIVGGGLLIYAIAADNAHPYFKIGGLIIIMIGLYRATNHWAATKDDHKEDENQE